VYSLDVAADPGLFAPPDSGTDAPGVATPVWMYPLILALILFVAEIALRQSRMWAQETPVSDLST
jgi:hypothetical protein